MVYEKKCPQCGNDFRTGRENQHYCCYSCARKGANAKRAKGNFDASLDWVRVDGQWECPYQVFVSCTVRHCDKCGWNPEVAKARWEKYKEEHNV